ncbi:MAG: hypothetical protein MJ247_04125 [Alphaproteobacteria bacterium]|nr:hypothetical protein [Alphaproteobacteria bacterium]
MIEQEVSSLKKDIIDDHQTGFFGGFNVINVGHRRFPLKLAFVLLIFTLIIVALVTLFVLVDMLNNPGNFKYTELLILTAILFLSFICISIRYTIKKGLV